MNTIAKKIKMIYVGLAFGLAYLLLFLSCPGYVCAAEVEGIEEAEISPELEEAIELKKISEFKIIPLVDITALGTYSKVSGGGDLGGVNVKGSIAPVLRIDKKNYIIPLYYGSYNREKQIVVEEEGARVYNYIMDHNVTLEYKSILTESTTFKLDGLMRLHYVKEKGYSWSDGLYDYKDFGAGSSFEYFFTKTRTQRSSIGIGGEYYHREYPNYKSLISLATVTAPETDEKDYNGYRSILRYKYLDKILKCTILYSPLFKDYDDKKVIDSNGVLKDKEREDWFHYVNADFSYLLEDTPFAIGLGLTGIINDSNQNYYDSRGTVTLADDVSTQNYYSFKSLKVNPKLTYIYRLEELKTPATFTLGYAYLIRGYDDRKAQRVGGSYTGDDQLDQIHTTSLQIVYPITQHISAVGIGTFTKAVSNMKYETYYRYRYESYFLGGGIRIKY